MYKNKSGRFIQGFQNYHLYGNWATLAGTSLFGSLSKRFYQKDVFQFIFRNWWKLLLLHINLINKSSVKGWVCGGFWRWHCFGRGPRVSIASWRPAIFVCRMVNTGHFITVLHFIWLSYKKVIFFNFYGMGKNQRDCKGKITKQTHQLAVQLPQLLWPVLDWKWRCYPQTTVVR